jgi:GT2 family glycosyltransferase/SAM-dependent methyltransferase
MPDASTFENEKLAFNAALSRLGLTQAAGYFWYHTIELPHGLVTPGTYDFRKTYPLYGFPDDMKGMRVLDIGSVTGFFTFEFLRRGADVVAVELPDLDSVDRFPGQSLGHTVKKLRRMLVPNDHTELLPGQERAQADELYRRLLLEPFDFCNKLLGLRARRCFNSVYALSTGELGSFDLVFMGDILLHTINPLAALSAVAPLCDRRLILAQQMPDSSTAGPALRYAAGWNPDEDEAQYWQPDAQCLMQLLQKLGFSPAIHGRAPVALRPSGHTFEHTVITAARGHPARKTSSDAASALPFTGERYVPQIGGDIRLEHLHRYAAARELLRGKIVLDIACGEGYGSNLLATTAQSVIGVDISDKAIDHARAKYVRDNLSFKTGSCLQIPMEDKSVDAVVCLETLEHVREQARLLSELRRVLRPGGLLVISTPNRQEYAGNNKNTFHERELTPDEFSTLLRDNFKNITVCGQRVVYGSHIIPPVSSAPRQLAIFGGSGSQVKKTGSLPAPLYLVALASDAALPPFPPSLFEGTALHRDKDILLEKRNREIEKLGNWGKTLDSQITTLRDSNIKLQTANAESGRTAAAQAEKINRLNAQHETTQKALTTLAQEIAALQKSREELHRECVKRGEWGMGLDREIAVLRDEISRLHSCEQDQHRRMDEILNSRSWRITAPLRLIADAVRVLRHKAGRKDNGQTSRLRVLVLPNLYSFCARTYRYLPFPPGIKQPLKTAFQKFFRQALGKTTRSQEAETEFWAGLPSYPLRFPQQDKPKVTIIIPVFGGAKLTYNCLESILANTGSIAYEVLVIDDKSPDMSARMLSSLPGLRLLRNHKNMGFLKSCNKAAKEARGEYLVLLNNDTLVQPRWLEELVCTLENTPSAGLAGGKLLAPDGTLLEAGGIVWSDASAWNMGRGDDAEKPEYNYLRDADYCSGACIAISKKLWDRLGGFDERYSPAYFEDTDLAFRVREAGLRVLYQPLAKISHMEKMSHGTDGAEKLMRANREKFAARWETALAAHRPNGENPYEEKERPVKKRVLVIDARTATPDQDSGSLDIYHHFKILLSLGYRPTFAPDNMAHAGRYTEDLQRMGVECLYYPQVRSITAHLKKHGALYNAVIIHRHYVAAAHIDDVRRYCPGAKILYDTVDLHFLREQRRAELEASPVLMEKAMHTRAQELSVAAKADCTIVLNEPEKKLLLRHNPSLEVAVLRPARDICPAATPFEDRRDIMFVGGYQHPPNVDAVLYFAKEIFPQIRKLLPGVRLHVLGSKAPEALARLACHDILVPGYVPDMSAFLGNCRLSIAPLRYGAGIKGKIIQSLAHGLPCVATTIACEGMELADGRDILCADSPGAFAATVERLYTDKVLWDKLSREGLDAVRRLYSVEAATAELRKLLEPSAIGQSE